MGALDFLVIGSQKAGTTTLWHLIRGHPQLDLPGAKEAPFFADDRLYALGLERYERMYFGPRRPGVLRGSVSPQYMFDSSTLEVGEIAARIGRDLPDVRLIALLRDPIERALSHHRMSVRRGYERRPAARALREQLAPGALRAARRPVSKTTPGELEARTYANSRYLVAGEYGRILESYREHFPRSHVLVLFTAELELDPGTLLDRLFEFLDVDVSWRPSDLGSRRLVGGDRVRVSPSDLRALREWLEASAPNTPIGAFDVALEEWNTLGEPAGGKLPGDLEVHLREHFLADADLLQKLCGVSVTWRVDHEPTAASDSPAPSSSPHRIEVSAQHVAGADEIAEQIRRALAGGTGYALIRIGVDEALVLGHGVMPVRVPDLADIGVREQPAAAAAALREAILAADAVALSSDRTTFAGAPLLERVLARFDLQPRLRCHYEIDYDLLGVDLPTGASSTSSSLLGMLSGRQVAAVCPAALAEHLVCEALDVRIAVGLDDMSEVEQAFMTLAASREVYDAVLVLAEVPAKSLCVRLARELDVVALDLGRPLIRYLNGRYSLPSAPGRARSRWELRTYLRQLELPPPVSEHELEGRLVRDPGGSVHYVERGRARLVGHPALLRLFDHEPVDIDSTVADALERGAPIAAVHERFSDPFLVLDGRKRALELGLPIVDVDDLALLDLPEDDRPVRWYPQA